MINAELHYFKTDRGRLLFLAFTGLCKKLEFPNCEGVEDRKRVVEHFERELATYELGNPKNI